MSFNTDKQQPSSKLPNIPLYALPNPVDLSPEDDWTRIKDRKMKNRIQNRVAQRTYRQRMKSRIVELQARVEQNEGNSKRQSAVDEEPFADSDPLDVVTQPNLSSTMAHMTTAGMASPSDSAGSPSLLDNDATINERFEYIMECVDALGFNDFDALVIAYYGEKFTESSQLANEQRLSRNRRLPKAIADIFNASKEWSAWERRGFFEEILRSTEAMLVAEKKDASSAINAALAPLMMTAETRNGANMANTAQVLQALKKTIPREVSLFQETKRFGPSAQKTANDGQLPNLWTIMIALASSNGTAWQKDSGSALAATLLLHCAGRVPKEQLLALIGACL
ncbi:bZIP transcription factor [Aspergillus fischeri NRRL 181]|uniref:BZIP domain-containing protein n=1 Tax=Neosartorya fischeri (strain ATCC 1020 / DSM 3700 / CBS 544.65 / FGSC A1164 / JCM 1740 / NRRL 181 / WB 181) TaxID=331117 RepID=A1DA51_NEOFI|nr:uncharacterized protein NFIA_031150 [Aspergillus fischeri NRRL 181]EAW20682.1 hypothetical protein NFIA_031150 [Aspergillus fischeri NRRL 181]KAG2001214.1 hypothetical protein GB937_010384 [Aspergillus fischeri]